MTRSDLPALLQQRNDAWEKLGHYNRPLFDLSREDRRQVEELTARYWDADRSIVQILVDADMPITVGEMVLHLTTDRKSFIELDRKMGHPVYASRESKKSGWKNLLYVYPTKSRKSA